MKSLPALAAALSISVWTGTIMAGAASALPASAHATSFRVLHGFTDSPDGATPDAGMIADAKGNLYGTALQGGAQSFGVIFKIAPGGSATILYSFKGGSDGNKPQAGVIADAAGDLYGTTFFGGADDAGTVYKLAPDGSETVLYAFTGKIDGNNPQAGLIADKSGNLYGTTIAGGETGQNCGSYGCGTVFELAPDGALTVLHAFTGGSDGGWPQAGLIADDRGNLYGTASGGGATGNGAVFRLAPDGEFTALYSFAGGADGAAPIAGLLIDKKGTLYGTTKLGGGTGCFGGGCGTVFELTPQGKETVLYSFTGGGDGGEPYAGVIADRKGNLYGTADGDGSGYGTAFKLFPGGALTVLHTFDGATDGEYPNSGVIADKRGHLFGITYTGGPGLWGTVFELGE